MIKNNISEINIKRLEIKTGGKVLDYFTEANSTYSTVTVRTPEGAENKIEVNKQDIANNFTIQRAQIVVNEDPNWNEVWEAFNATYGLGLVRNVDYSSSIAKVDLTVTPNVILTIKDESLLYMGEVTVSVSVKPKDNFDTSLKKVGEFFNTIILKGLLAVNQPFVVENKAFTRNQLSSATMKVVRSRFKDSEYVTDNFLNQLAAARIIKYQTFSRNNILTVKVYLKDNGDNLYSLSIVPADITDRPDIA